MTKFLSSPKLPQPERAAAPEPEDPAIAQARQQQLEARRKAKGRAATVLTGNNGDEGRLSRPVLLGG